MACPAEREREENSNSFFYIFLFWNTYNAFSFVLAQSVNYTIFLRHRTEVKGTVRQHDGVLVHHTEQQILLSVTIPKMAFTKYY